MKELKFRAWDGTQMLTDEMMKWYRLRKHLEELAGVKEEE